MVKFFLFVVLAMPGQRPQMESTEMPSLEACIEALVQRLEIPEEQQMLQVSCVIRNEGVRS